MSGIGGIVKYFNLPLFQSSTTILAPCFIYGTPPYDNNKYYLPEFAMRPTYFG